MSGTHSNEILAMLGRIGFWQLSADEQAARADSLIVAGFNLLAKLRGPADARAFIQAMIDNPDLIQAHTQH